jgi:calmodulin
MARQQLDAEAVQEYKEIFDKYAYDKGNGISAIGIQELGKCFEDMHVKVTNAQLEAMVNEVDEDGSNEIEFNEFLDIFTKSKDTVDDTRRVFDAMCGVDDNNEQRDTLDIHSLRIAAARVGEQLNDLELVELMKIAYVNAEMNADANADADDPNPPITYEMFEAMFDRIHRQGASK